MTSRTQPVKVPTGLPYGERQQLEQAQKAIPLPRTGPAGTAPPGAPSTPPNPNVFAPTQRPNEPITAGAAQGAGPSPILPDMSGTELLRALIANGYDTSGDLRKMLERTQPKQQPQRPPSPQGPPPGMSLDPRPQRPQPQPQPQVEMSPQPQPQPPPPNVP